MKARTTALLFVLALAIAAIIFIAAGPDPAGASGACSVREARRIMVRERAQYREAVRVYNATRHYSEAYRADVGRWVRLSRRCGWSWSAMPTLMYVLERESKGQPRAVNPASGASGLMQLIPLHWQGRFDPLVPSANLRYGLKLYRGAGWQPWVVVE